MKNIDWDRPIVKMWAKPLEYTILITLFVGFLTILFKFPWVALGLIGSFLLLGVVLHIADVYEEDQKYLKRKKEEEDVRKKLGKTSN